MLRKARVLRAVRGAAAAAGLPGLPRRLGRRGRLPPAARPPEAAEGWLRAVLGAFSATAEDGRAAEVVQ